MEWVTHCPERQACQQWNRGNHHLACVSWLWRPLTQCASPRTASVARSATNRQWFVLPALKGPRNTVVTGTPKGQWYEEPVQELRPAATKLDGSWESNPASLSFTLYRQQAPTRNPIDPVLVGQFPRTSIRVKNSWELAWRNRWKTNNKTRLSDFTFTIPLLILPLGNL